MPKITNLKFLCITYLITIKFILIKILYIIIIILYHISYEILFLIWQHCNVPSQDFQNKDFVIIKFYFTKT